MWKYCRRDFIWMATPLNFVERPKAGWRDKTSRTWSGCKVTLLYTLGRLRWHYGEGNENVKKAIGLDQPNNNSARVPRFSVHFFAVTARLRSELPNFEFHRQLEHTTTNFAFSPFLKNSTPGKFACVGQSERVVIVALKFQRTRIHFLRGVFAAVAFVVS